MSKKAVTITCDCDKTITTKLPKKGDKEVACICGKRYLVSPKGNIREL